MSEADETFSFSGPIDPIREILIQCALATAGTVSKMSAASKGTRFRLKRR
jgi:hypothetical protein